MKSYIASLLDRWRQIRRPRLLSKSQLPIGSPACAFTLPMQPQFSGDKHFFHPGINGPTWARPSACFSTHGCLPLRVCAQVRQAKNPVREN